jgi:hypothetical protein
MIRPVSLIVPLVVVLVLAGAIATPLGAATSWVSIKDYDGVGTVCIESGGRAFDYARLGAGDQGSCTVHGPRRIKLISRYLFAAGDDERVPYTLIVAVDGREVLRKRFSGQVHDTASRCGSDEAVASLRRGYLELAPGEHRVSFRAEHAGGGRVGVRVFREVRRQRERWVTFAPESYESVRHLQFESGNQSTYYHFDATTPLRFSITGPTSLRVGTRLDFGHTMNGSQTYTLEVCLDGESWQTFHLDAEELTTAVYVEQPDILAGGRREFRIGIPKGRHSVEIRCLRPEACGVAAMIHIPKSDLER